jgi:hypothetical protein
LLTNPLTLSRAVAHAQTIVGPNIKLVYGAGFAGFSALTVTNSSFVCQYPLALHGDLALVLAGRGGSFLATGPAEVAVALNEGAQLEFQASTPIAALLRKPAADRFLVLRSCFVGDCRDAAGPVPRAQPGLLWRVHDALAAVGRAVAAPRVHGRAAQRVRARRHGPLRRLERHRRNRPQHHRE